MGSFATYFLLWFFVTTSHQISGYRLPNVWRPIHYKISLTPYLIPDKFKFDGKTIISLQILERTKSLFLNSFNLEIREETLVATKGQQAFPIIQRQFDNNKQILRLKFEDTLEPGYYHLYLEQSGYLSNSSKGFFRHSYYHGNETRVLAATNFAPTYARRVFPCWDEPGAKAMFEISIRHEIHYKALSNMPLRERRTDTEFEGMVWSEFKTTPAMSTCNVAFAVSDLRKTNSADFTHSMWSRMPESDFVNMGLIISLRAKTALQRVTRFPYALPKLDVFWVPTLRRGVSLSWGLIIIPERFLFGTTSSPNERRFEIVRTIIDANAHQWFGNLVTPAWWDDFWITEGLNVYLKYFLTRQVMPFPDFEQRFMLDIMFRSFQVDEDPDTLPVLRPISSPVETERIFNSENIRTRAGAVFYMMASILSQKVFYAGIRRLLLTCQYRTVSSDDFWRTMQETMNEHDLPHIQFNIKSRIEPYLSRKGYPVVTVSRNYETGDVRLRQLCFGCDEVDIMNTKWWIPINFATSSSLDFSHTVATHWMNPNKEELIIEGIDPNDWIVINIKNSGYYRVNYDVRNWQRLSDYLNSHNFRNIHYVNRAKLLDDALWTAKRNERVSLDLLHDMVGYAIREDDILPRFIADEVREYVKRRMIHDE